MRRRALLLGYYGARNLGDEMMLHHLLPWLRDQNVQVTVVSESPAMTEEQFATPAMPNAPLLGQWSWFDSWFRGRAAKLLRAIRTVDCLVVGGGDLIRDDAGWRTFSYTLEKIVLAILWKKPVYLVNVGIGQPQTRHGRLVLKWVLPRCRRIIVRDQRSLQLCKELRATAHLDWAPDIALQRWRGPGPELAEAPPREPYVVVSLRANPNVHGRFPFGPDRVRALAGALDYLVNQHRLSIRFIPFQSIPELDDNRTHHQVREHMTRAERTTIQEWKKNPAEVADQFRSASLVVAMPLHAAVLAVASETPCVVLPYDIKVDEFVAYSGVKEVLSSKDLAEADRVRDSLERALSQSRSRPAIDTGAVWKNLKLC